VNVRAEVARRIKPTLTDRLPRFAIENLTVDLDFPNNLKRLTLRIIIKTCESNERTDPANVVYSLNQVSTRANADDLPGFRDLIADFICLTYCQLHSSQPWNPGIGEM
jgi:hypothetical protein